LPLLTKLIGGIDHEKLSRDAFWQEHYHYLHLIRRTSSAAPENLKRSIVVEFRMIEFEYA
jgi:hypothetical protein